MPPTKRLTSSPDPGPSRPPRPPNAWILFRSDIWKALPPPPPGETHLPQAAISKIIAKMWQEESPETRAYYEHKSEVQRAEHCARHPDYQFRPTKNTKKKRLRAQGLAKKRLRASQKAPPRTRPGTLHDPFTGTACHHGPAGPPSPMFVANDSIFSDLMAPTPSDHSLSSDCPLVTASSSSYPSLYPSPPSITVIPPLVVPQPSMLQPSPLVPQWPLDALMPSHEQDYIDLLFAQHQPQDHVRFGLPEVGLPFTSLNPLFCPPLDIPLGWHPHDPSPATDHRFYNEPSMLNISNNSWGQGKHPEQQSVSIDGGEFINANIVGSSENEGAIGTMDSPYPIISDCSAIALASEDPAGPLRRIP